jgi:hypothetical protein
MQNETARQQLSSNSITKGLNACTEEEIATTDFQKAIIKMINELKEESQKLISDLKDDVNK